MKMALKKNSICRISNLIIVLFYVILICSCLGEPSRELIIQDIHRLYGETSFKEVNVVGISIEGKIAYIKINALIDRFLVEKEVPLDKNLEALGPWKSVEFNMTYRKYDSGWKFEYSDFEHPDLKNLKSEYDKYTNKN